MLLHPALFKTDFIIECGGKAKGDSGFHLGDNCIRINGLAAVNRTCDPVHPNGSVLTQRYFCNLGHITAERGMHGHSPGPALFYRC